jgi:hypothetical protein
MNGVTLDLRHRSRRLLEKRAARERLKLLAKAQVRDRGSHGWRTWPSWLLSHTRPGEMDNTHAGIPQIKGLRLSVWLDLNHPVRS